MLDNKEEDEKEGKNKWCNNGTKQIVEILELHSFKHLKNVDPVLFCAFKAMQSVTANENLRKQVTRFNIDALIDRKKKIPHFDASCTA